MSAFAARADTPLGALGSLVLLGGVWNRHVVPPGQGSWPVTAGQLGLAVTAGWGFWTLGRAYRRRRHQGQPADRDDALPGAAPRGQLPGGSGEQDRDGGPRGGPGPAVAVPWWSGLAVAALAGFALAAAGATAPGRAGLGWAVRHWWPAGILRDGQQFVAPLALLTAVGLGAAVDLACRSAGGARAPARPVTRGAALSLAGLGVVAPLALLPALAFGAAGRLAPVTFPDDWRLVRAVVDGDPSPGTVLVLPWTAYRTYPWNRGRVVLDPAPRVFRRRTVVDDTLAVGPIQVRGEDELAHRVGPAVRSGGPLAGPLRRYGIRFVLVERSDPAEGAALVLRLRDARPVLATANLLLFRLDPPAGG